MWNTTLTPLRSSKRKERVFHIICDYLGSQRLRQEIQEALNVIEQWNSVNGFIFSGRGGEQLSNRPEDQEIAVLCLHLIQVSLALVNTLMLQDVLADKQWKDAMSRRIGAD